MLEKATAVALRLAGLLMMALGLGTAAAHLLQAWGELDLIYIDLFLRARMVAPLAALVLGLVFWLGSRPLARWLTHDLAKD